MTQLLLHLIGDYITQSDWMAITKGRSHFAALCHATVYSLPFLLIGSPAAVLVIWASHFFVDRYRLARYVVFAKNFIGGPPYPVWDDCRVTGYPSERPMWFAFWLLLIADAVIHLSVNYAALRWIG